ncbi:YbaB/EbfC family nucleoid-associated protein [Saccharothrix sp. S26]|uniref:YbaB/EbfC family nucleoid-associated protein n=1 Tax=Saccharothrix sp. S26 TaxID=2907215 RepID=UPI001F1FC613|nr:YbaB/EbfC family nucleoid-associated protein [Saccharothrix sp. S26]MCE6994843.1 YbaB/EbfC family nucleoid-associated protein [Saccharothrix sp. S26]
MTDPHQYVERFEQQLQDAQRKADAIQGAFRESRAEARSPDGAVVVAVASGGRIESLQLTPKAMDLGHTALGRTIVDTIRRAQVEVARKVEESVRPLLGDGESMRYLREQVEQGIAVIDPVAPPAASPTPQRPATRDDDEFEGGTFLR